MAGPSRPTVSVCIPVYNCENYIGQAIESVLAQTYTDFELVIANNASTDKTAEIINTYKDPRIRQVNNERNSGLAGNWNRVLAEAKGAYIKLLCADDVMYPTCLEKQVQILHDPANNNVVLVNCGRDIIDGKGKYILKRNFGNYSGKMSGKRTVKKVIRSGTNIIGEPPAVLFRREAAAKIGKFDDSNTYLIDLDYWCRLLLQGGIYILSESLCAFRVSSNSDSVVIKRNQGREFRKIIFKLYAQPVYGLSLVDCLFGSIAATINNYARKVIYKIFVSQANNEK